MSGPSIVVDVVVAVLLVVTIGFVWRLERRIALLKREEARFAELLGDFAQAAGRAELGVKALKATAEGAGRELEAVIARAQGLRDDINYLLDRAGPVTDRLSDAVMRSRIRPSQTAAAQETPAGPPRSGPAREELAARGPASSAGIPAGADPANLASLLQSLR